MPVEFCLEFMAVISPDLADPKWELLDNVVHEVYGVGLRVLFIDFLRKVRRSDTRNAQLNALYVDCRQ